jgi:hypothetical protein
MRFMIMHKTGPHWESGAIPGPDLVARVGAMLGEMRQAGALLAAEGLRPSSQGVRLRFSAGVRTVIPGPFPCGHELPAGFSIVRVGSLDEVIQWASRQAEALGDCEMDIRPVTESWDIGLGSRPADVTTRRYMILRKADARSEAGDPASDAQRTKLSRLIEETTASGAHLVTETMRPSTRGRRYRNSKNGVTYYDGPFIESKELLGGYVVVAAASMDEAHHWVLRYIDAVGADEVDVRELE